MEKRQYLVGVYGIPFLGAATFYVDGNSVQFAAKLVAFLIWKNTRTEPRDNRGDGRIYVMDEFRDLTEFEFYLRPEGVKLIPEPAGTVYAS